MTVTTQRESGGRLLAERLGREIVGEEGHDLKCACPFCSSSDAGRIDRETGAFHCYSCGKGMSGFDLAKNVLGGDRKAAYQVMVAVGLRQDYMDGGNGKAGSKALSPAVQSTGGNAKPTDNDIIDQLARHKGTTGDGFRAYGAIVKNGVVMFPTFRLADGKAERISYFYIDPANPSDKGKNAAGKPAGIFLPVIPAATANDKPCVRRPQPGETWIVCEGAKNAAAYATLGRNAVGLNGKHVKKDFLPGFVAALRGVDVILIPDGDLQSVEAFKKLGASLL